MATVNSKTMMSFGQHEGEFLGDIPASYLLWLYDQPWIGKYPEIVAYVEKERDALEKEANENS